MFLERICLYSMQINFLYFILTVHIDIVIILLGNVDVKKKFKRTVGHLRNMSPRDQYLMDTEDKEFRGAGKKEADGNKDEKISNAFMTVTIEGKLEGRRKTPRRINDMDVSSKQKNINDVKNIAGNRNQWRCLAIAKMTQELKYMMMTMSEHVRLTKNSVRSRELKL